MDDLLDLDWNRKPSSTSTAQPTLSRSNNGSSYNFDALTRSLPQSQQLPINRSGASTPTTTAAKRPQQQQNINSSNSDAFSSLLGFDSSNLSSSSSTTISMAERLKREQQQKLGFPAQTVSKQPSVPLDSAWEGLDSFLSVPKSKPAPAQQPMRSQPAKIDDDDDLWSFASNQKVPDRPTAKDTGTAPASKQAHPFDFSEFEDPGNSQSSALGGGSERKAHSQPKQQRSQPVILDDSDEESDLLGGLGRTKPAAKAPEDFQASRPTPSLRTNHTKAHTRSVSPPPHIIGQIVEMGFSPNQARQALAATESGLDVSVAIEMLLEEAKTMQPSQEESRESDRRMALRLQREEESMRSDRRITSTRARPDEMSKANGLDVPPEWQKQADQIYSQASEIGATMFSKANALWSTAKAQAQRALEEGNMRGNDSGQSSGRSSPATGSERAKNRRWAVASRDGSNQRKEWQGKPKWMIDAENEEQQNVEGPKQTNKSKDSNGGSFRDDDDGDTGVVPAKPFIERPAVREQQINHNNAEDLWGQNEESSNSIKPPAMPTSRRSSPLQSALGSRTESPAPRKAVVTKSVKVEDKSHRQTCRDDPGSIQSSANLKQRGNELFKRGAYGEAEVAYGNALSALESNSLRRVALLNNRASARLRNGDARSALGDTKDVLMLIVMGENKKGSPFLLYRPSKEHSLPMPEYADVNLREGYSKALLRRAQAEEMLEQWETAQSVWSLLERYEKEEGSGKSGITNLRAAQDGSKRCNKMLRGGDVELTAPASRRVQAAALQAVAKAEKMAKERIRAENAVAAAEEQEKDSLRDVVDARILAWKGGKEANVRALLASLHDVVWPGLNWKRVGMHELVMDNQVKRCYMRAIGKLHPDKLTPKTNTIEERMIGGAVFSVLNDAWSTANAS